MKPLSDASWWWTLASFGSCHRCGRDVTGEPIAYTAATRTVLCGACADEAGVSAECRESRAARSARVERLSGVGAGSRSSAGRGLETRALRRKKQRSRGPQKP
jgi:hypothetical protein